MKLVHLGLAALAAACGNFPDRPGSSFDVYVDPAFGPQLGDVVAAVDAWQSAAPGLVMRVQIAALVCDSSCTHTITIHPSTTAAIAAANHVASFDPFGSCDREWHDDHNGEREYANISVASDISPDDWHKVVLHEIGHGLALQHTGSGTVMCSPTDCGASSITPADVAQYQGLR